MARTGRAFPQSTRARTSKASVVTPYATPAGQKWLAWKVLSTAGTNATLIKQGSGTLGPISLVNTNASTRYLHIYDAIVLAMGTTVPSITFALPPSEILFFRSDGGLTFSTGLCFSLTTGAADNDTGAVAADEVTGVICWI